MTTPLPRAWLAFPLLFVALALPCAAQERVTKDDKGRIRAVPLPTEAKFTNPWTPALEDEFWDRANHAIAKSAKAGRYGTTFGEMEKSAYPNAMMDFLSGNRAPALKYLQERDAEGGADSACGGIDYYWCFTLKGQMRKYFYFGQYLDPAYKQQMFDNAKVWTATDPAKRPHPDPDKTTNPSWGAKKTRVCVDTRNTDNLQAMRIAAVYLMAEETGNEATRLAYKEHIARAVRNMYRIGMGEWDSENYHGHTMTGYIQLYDFAKDPQVKLMGKAAMDFLCATGAFKYWRGAFGGPTKRDYNHPHVWGGSAADHLGLYFGDCPIPNDAASSDNVYFITSAYRPPPAVVGLARKEFKRPCEVLASHPDYNALRGDGSAPAPAFYETMYFGQTFQLGTLSIGTNGPKGDVNGFKLLAHNSQRGADYFIANTNPNPLHIGSAQYAEEGVGGNNVAQFRNLAVWLCGTPEAPFLFYVPKSATIETQAGVMFLKYEKTWLAVHPINLKIEGVNKELTEQINVSIEKDKKGVETGKKPRWPEGQIISAKGQAPGSAAPVCGFALEVGEQETHGDFAAFKTAVTSKAKLDLSAFKDGVVEYAGATGAKVKLKYTAGQPTVWRNGVEHDWAKHLGLYQPANAASGGASGGAPIRMEWKSGKLRVEAGGYVFEGAVAEDGTYTFSNGKAP